MVGRSSDKYLGPRAEITGAVILMVCSQDSFNPHPFGEASAKQRAFLKMFVKEIKVAKDKVTILYALPTPLHNLEEEVV